MTGDSLTPEQPPSGPLYARESHEPPTFGASRRPGGGSGPQTGAEGFEPESACAHCGDPGHAWDDCEAYTKAVADQPTPARRGPIDYAREHAAAAERRPASTAPLAAGLPLVQGRCPACGGSSLFLGDGGYVTCSRIDCPEPDAASTLLEKRPASAIRALDPQEQS